MFPLKDENPTDLTPYVTVLIIGANGLAWFALQSAGSGEGFLDSLCAFGTIPGEITGALAEGTEIRRGPFRCRAGGATWSTLLTSMFMHGGWFHLILNMWFLWVFGNNIEDSMGHLRYLVFYLVTGVLAGAAHIASAPGSDVPTVGASGAISGVMGAYLVLYPRVRVYTAIPIFVFIRILPLPAWLLLGEWLLIQLLMGGLGGGGGVAVWAHIGGFVAGLVLVFGFRDPSLVAAREAHERRRGPPRRPW